MKYLEVSLTKILEDGSYYGIWLNKQFNGTLNDFKNYLKYNGFTEELGYGFKDPNNIWVVTEIETTRRLIDIS